VQGGAVRRSDEPHISCSLSAIASSSSVLCTPPPPLSTSDGASGMRQQPKSIGSSGFAVACKCARTH
jgi:hypothetical protein